MTSVTTRKLSKLIGQINEAALTPALWPEALDGVRHLMAGSAALLHTPFHGADAGGITISCNLSAETMARYAETYHQLDVWTLAGKSRKLFSPGRVVTDEDLVPRDHLLASAYYQKFLAPANISRLCTSVVFGENDPGNLPMVLSIYRGIDAQPFGRAEKSLLRLLTPHLSRSLGLMFRLRDTENKLAASLGALDKLACGIVLFGRDGRVVHTNRAASELFKPGADLCLSAGDNCEYRLSAASREETRHLDGFIINAVSTSATEALSAPHNMRISGSSGRPPVILSISSLPCNHAFDTRAGQAVAIGFLFDCTLPERSNAQMLGEIFGLTPAEIRLANELCSGWTIADIGAFHGVSTETLKSQLKSIFLKTGTHRQIDLVRMADALAIKK